MEKESEFRYPLFEGEIEKIVVESETSGFMRTLEWPDEIRQRITMRRNGFVSLTRYYAGLPGAKSKRMERYRCKPTEKIMEYIAGYFRESHDSIFACDAGIWTVYLFNTNGQNWMYRGYMCEDLEVADYKLSAITRKILEMPDLWLFDGKMEGDCAF